MDKDSLKRKFDKQASMYEQNTRHRTLGVWRKRLLADAEGRILEIAVGAGANFPFYRKDRAHITAVDFSPEMLNSARRIAAELGISATFIQGDVESLELPARSFDAVVSTLSLCGYDDPVGALNKMNRWCRKGGSIYLLEHGISSNRLLGFAQHLINPIARRTAGCNFNRDMVGIIETSDVAIVKIEHYWNGIIHVVWAQAT